MKRYQNTTKGDDGQDDLVGSPTLDRRFRVTFFPNERGQRKTDKRLSLRQMEATIKATSAADKAGLPFLKMAAFGKVRSPLRPKSDGTRTGNSLRHDANVLAVTGVEVDLDNCPFTPLQARHRLRKAGLLHLLFTTPSHGLPGKGNRFRAFFPFSDELSPGERERMVARVNGLLGGKLDDASFNLSQSFYIGSVDGRPPVKTWLSDGRYLDTASDLDAGARGRRGRAKTEKTAAGEKTGRPWSVIRDALFAIPNDADRDGWLRVGMALHHETDGAADGFSAFDEWSALHDSYDADATSKAWDSFGRSTGVLTAFYILNLATDHGWRDPRIDEMFDSIWEDQRAEEEMQADIDDLVGDPLFSPASSWAKDEPPRREWLVEGLIPNGTVTMLGGDGGTGKSLLALQLAVATATGGRWIGRNVDRPGKVMFLSAEDDRDELHRRLSSICDSEGVGLRDLNRLLIRSLAGEDALLATLDRKSNTLKATALFNALDKAMAAGPACVVLDTLADLHSGEENQRAHARQFIGMLRGLAIRHNCAVLLLAHPSLTGMTNGSGLSGSTAWNASVRSRLYLDRVRDEQGLELDTDTRVLKTVKANYGATGGEITMHWHDGVFVPDVQDFSEQPEEKARRVFLRLLDAFTAQRRYVSPNVSSTYAPSMFATHHDREGVGKPAFARAMESLLADGSIVIGEHGKPGKERQHLERANP